MATRNLARTVTEGGRARWYRDMERFGTRSERTGVKHRLRKMTVEGGEDFSNQPRRWHDYDDGFRDKFGAVHKWLASQAGRPWDKVFSELCRRYDRRTLKGWHLIDGHVNRSYFVAKETDPYNLGGAFPPREGHWVDRHGILRFTPRTKWWIR